MSAYLITGRGGSGKTAVCLELRRRGLPAQDADRVPGLASAVDRATGDPVEVDWDGYVDFSKVGWAWDSATLDRLLAGHKTLFLCGSSSNQFDFFPRFAKTFVLTLDPDTQRQRLRSRDSRYGKHPDMERHILQEQQKFVRDATARGAVPVDATQPLTKLADEILEQTEVLK